MPKVADAAVAREMRCRGSPRIKSRLELQMPGQPPPVRIDRRKRVDLSVGIAMKRPLVGMLIVGVGLSGAVASAASIEFGFTGTVYRYKGIPRSVIWGSR